jgi:uncharacterized membrane protein YjgN (DUF898 family)
MSTVQAAAPDVAAPAAPAAPAAAPPAVASVPPAAPVGPGGPSNGAADLEVHPVRFTGTGGGYFRVWIVNLVLMVLTLGLYTPWARRRTARWFFDHTEVAGSPLEFAAPMRRMVFGFLVFAGLYIAYEIASRTGQEAVAYTMIGGAAVLAPLAWRGAMRFRTTSTRWRGLQLHFSASTLEVYRASWPLALIAVVWAAVFAAGFALEAGDEADRAAQAARRGLAVLVLPLATLAALVAGGLLFVRLDYGLRRLLFERGGLGDVSGRFKPTFGAFLRISLIAGGVWIALVGAVWLGVFLLGGGLIRDLASLMGSPDEVQDPARWAALAALLLLPFSLFLFAVPAYAWREARVFALVWNGAGLGRIVRTQCTLSAARFMWMRIVNVGLTLVTLGLWRPFARVREYRMKVESVRLHVRGGLDTVTGRLQAQSGGVGDMLADAVGLDVIG